MEQKYAVQLETYEKFWNREPLSRPVLSITAPKKSATPFPAPASLEQKWLDEKYIAARARRRVENTYFAADAVPSRFTNLGPGSLAACIGGNFRLAPNTVWFDRNPIIDDWENPPAVALNRQSEAWQHIERIQTELLSCPEFNTTLSDIGGIFDVVAALRGTENLLYDLYDYPDEVKEMTDRVTDLWFEAFEGEADRIRKAGQRFNSWINLPSVKPWFPIQCDFSYMISPAQFEEFILPHLTRQTEVLDRSVYHLDGVGELPHLDMLLNLEGLNGIQWSPGDGKPPMWDPCWFDTYRKIQDKKKNLVLLIGISHTDMAAAERLVKTLDPTGLYLACGAPDEDTADRIAEAVDRWCR